MRRSRFTEEQMVKILREADARPIAEVSKKHGVSDQTIYAWRKRFGALEAVDVKRLRKSPTAVSWRCRCRNSRRREVKLVCRPAFR